MAKRSQRCHVRRAKVRLVRVWGLISILDFRHFRSPRKMLIYERQRSIEPAGSGKSTWPMEEQTKLDENENLQGTRVDREASASVKTLIEKETGKECKLSDSRQKGRRIKTGKKGKIRSKQSQYLNQGDLGDGKKWALERPCQQNTEQGLENILGDKGMVEEFCHQIYPNQVEERLCEAVKELLSQQLICGKRKELVNMSQNLQDSHYVREKMSNSLSKANLPGAGEFEQLNFFGKNPGFQERRPSDETEHAQAIVILKPNLIHSGTALFQDALGEEQGARTTRRSFLSSIKRRLRSAIPFSKYHFYVQNASRAKAGDKNHKMANNSELTVSKINIQAKKYLSEMLSSSDEGSGTLTAALSDKLGRILSLPEFSCSPGGSPRRDTSLTARSRFCHTVKFPREIGSTVDSNTIVPAEQTVETESSTNEIVAEEIGFAAFASAEHTNLEENTGESDESLAESCSTAHLCEAPYVNECEQHVRKNFVGENGSVLCPSLSRPCALSMGNAEDPETGIDRAEQPSPVSVLEPLFTEEDYSSTGTASKYRGHPIQMLQIEFEDRDVYTTAWDIYKEILNKESVFNYVKAVLQTFELNWDQLYLKSLSSDQLLEIALLREVDFFGDFLFRDKKLLLDCINEVLLEFCGHYSLLRCFYFSDKIHAIHKVCERVYSHLLPPPLPHTLEQIIGKDLSGSDVWMDLHSEGESLHVDMGEIILKELIQDTFTSFVNRTPET